MLANGKHLTARQLAEQLEVSDKTIYRDLDFMRDRLGLPICTDAKGLGAAGFIGGYYFTERVNLCPCCLGLMARGGLTT